MRFWPLTLVGLVEEVFECHSRRWGLAATVLQDQAPRVAVQDPDLLPHHVTLHREEKTGLLVLLIGQSLRPQLN